MNEHVEDVKQCLTVEFFDTASSQLALNGAQYDTYSLTDLSISYASGRIPFPLVKRNCLLPACRHKMFQIHFFFSNKKAQIISLIAY